MIRTVAIASLAAAAVAGGVFTTDAAFADPLSFASPFGRTNLIFAPAMREPRDEDDS